MMKNNVSQVGNTNSIFVTNQRTYNYNEK